ncbi:hypothetical protein BC835DRAFT_1287670 [Cytidiella melzeri]|nr:hypothetical protein BC835DRAFT_1287670 [Cytidiella melzeri]
MSALRRFAQENHAIATSPAPPTTPSTPVRGQGGPSTPRTRLVYPHSPLTSPSRSASTPFDWEAARARRPAPYSTPLGGKRVRTLRNASPPRSTPTKKGRVVRKKGLVEKITSIPSEIAFAFSQFPNNLPLPKPQKLAVMIGGSMHLCHFAIRVSQISQVPVSDLPWEQIYREDESAWFDWTFPVSILIVMISVGNAFYLFTRTRMYQLALATDPVGSPHAKFVAREGTPHQDDVPPSSAALVVTVLRHLWHAFTVSVRFLLNMTPPKDKQMARKGNIDRIQQLQVWTPGELELSLLSIYSPVHFLLWMALTSANWIIMTFVMGVVSMQIRALIKSFQALQKDRAIISAEVLHEYDEKFVIPRVNPIRKDAATMTHQAEMVNAWD